MYCVTNFMHNEYASTFAWNLDICRGKMIQTIKNAFREDLTSDVQIKIMIVTLENLAQNQLKVIQQSGKPFEQVWHNELFSP